MAEHDDTENPVNDPDLVILDFTMRVIANPRTTPEGAMCSVEAVRDLRRLADNIDMAVDLGYFKEGTTYELLVNGKSPNEMIANLVDRIFKNPN